MTFLYENRGLNNEKVHVDYACHDSPVAICLLE